MSEPGAAPRQQLVPSRAARLSRWLMLAYLCGVLGDLAWHVHLDLTTGDRAIESYEWVIGVQASLFWPLDLLAQALLPGR